MQETKLKRGKTSRKEKERVKLNTLNKSYPRLILTVLLNQVYSQTNKKVISNIKLKGLGPEKVSIK